MSKKQKYYIIHKVVGKTWGKSHWHFGYPAFGFVCVQYATLLSQIQWVEQSGERASVCKCVGGSIWKCVHVCVWLIIHVWLNTVGHQQLRQASAVERDESCHRQVTLDRSQNDLHPSFFPSLPPPPPFQISHTWRYNLLLGLINPPTLPHPKKARLQWPYSSQRFLFLRIFHLLFLTIPDKTILSLPN